MRLGLALLLSCSGCLVKPNDGGKVPSCVGVPFLDGTTKIPAFHQGEYEPHERSDELEMWMTNTIAPDGFFHLFVATRGSVTDPYSEPRVAIYRSGFHTGSPSLTRDGLRLTFNIAEVIYEARRATTAEPFPDMPSQALGLESVLVEESYLTADGLTMYFARFGTLFSATRPDLESPFRFSNTVLATGVGPFGLSPDELELFYNPDTPVFDVHMWRSTRTRVDEPFPATRELVLAEAGQPTVSYDGTRLLFAAGGSLWAAHRPCN